MLDKPSKPEQLTLEDRKPRILVQNGGGEILDPFPPGSKEAAFFSRARDQGGKLSYPDWDWLEGKADICIPSQPAIAVYRNPDGHIVIRQEAAMHPDEDHWIYVQHENIELLIMKLQDMLK
jgi:hypothetical protein